MKWKVKFLPAVVNDLSGLDKSIRARILKSIPKLERDPVGYGTPLGNKHGIDLSRCYKTTPIDGYRMVYWIKERIVVVTVIAVGKREREKVYKSAAERIREYYQDTEKEFEKLESLLPQKKHS